MTPISNDALALPERHLFLSPHYDDIALSCGGTAARLRQLGRTPEVAIIFGSEPEAELGFTPFAAAMHAGWRMDASEVIARRRAEEAVAAQVLGTDVSFLPFHDAIYRGDRYLNDPELFGDIHVDEAGLPEGIISALDLRGAGTPSVRIYVPLAIGRHVDHQIAFHAGVALQANGWSVWFYEDLPYALKPGLRTERIAGAGIGLEIGALVAVDGTWDAKIDAVMSYPSQLATIFSYVGSGSSRAEVEALLRGYAEEAGNGAAVERFWTGAAREPAFVRGHLTDFNIAPRLL